MSAARAMAQQHSYPTKCFAFWQKAASMKAALR